MTGKLICIIVCLVLIALAAFNVDVKIVDRLGVILGAAFFWVLAQIVV